MNASSIFWPVIVQALLTLSLFVPMFRSRVAAVKAGEVTTGNFRLRETEPERSAKYVNAITNQYETPVLYYAVCIIAYVTATVGPVMLVLAWLWCLAKVAHILIFVTSNRLRHRMPAFGVSAFVLLLMWLTLAVSLLTA